MSNTGSSDGSAMQTRHVVVLAFGILAVLFALIPQTRSLAFVLLWILAPIVTFGTLVQVVRGGVDLRSGRGLLFAMWCSAIAIAVIPLGILVDSPAVAEGLTFLGLFAAILGIGFAQLSVTPVSETGDREIPPPQVPDDESSGSELTGGE